MTICAISDTHGKHHELSLSEYPADVLVHAGDWTGGRDLGLSETLDFLEWLEEQPFKHKVLIAGNHETQVEADLDHFKKVLAFTAPSVTYLHDSEVVISGIKFYGSPYSNEFCNWAFMENDLELEKRWNKIPEDTNVLITHGPAYRCNDLIANQWGGFDPNVGSKSLRYKKLALQDSLKLHISGHIHEAYGIVITKNVININASILDEKYRLVNEPIVTTLKG